MGVEHSKNLVIGRNDLLGIADARLREAEQLSGNGQYAGAMFIGGCALECYLKAAICMTLKLEGLPTVFKTHNLEALVLYSGFQHDLHEAVSVKKSFDEIVKVWGVDGRKSLLYRSPSELDDEKAKEFLDSLWDTADGVIPWLRKLLS